MPVPVYFKKSRLFMSFISSFYAISVVCGLRQPCCRALISRPSGTCSNSSKAARSAGSVKCGAIGKGLRSTTVNSHLNRLPYGFIINCRVVHIHGTVNRAGAGSCLEDPGGGIHG